SRERAECCGCNRYISAPTLRSVSSFASCIRLAIRAALAMLVHLLATAPIAVGPVLRSATVERQDKATLPEDRSLYRIGPTDARWGSWWVNLTVGNSLPMR